MSALVILFARAPVPGRAKTRLASVIGPEAAAEGARAFVHDLLSVLVSRFSMEVHTNEPTDAWNSWPVRFLRQTSGDLGERMRFALDDAFVRGHQPVAILDSDVPTLPAKAVERLFSIDADIVFGPSLDGGYWGVACRKTNPLMFEGVEWATENTLAQSVAACRRAGLSCELGPLWYDVDTVNDVDRLRSDPALASRAYTHKWIASLRPGKASLPPQNR